MAFLKISNEELFFIEFGIEFHSILPRKVAAWIIRDIIPQTIEEEDHQHQLEIEEKDREYQQLIEEIRDFRDLVQNLNVERIGDKNTALAASYSGLLMIILGYLAVNIFIRSCNLI